MEYAKVEQVGEQLKTVQVRQVPQAALSPECWIVQFQGLAGCKSCGARNTDDCGGPEIRLTGRNELGFLVPIGTQEPGDETPGKVDGLSRAKQHVLMYQKIEAHGKKLIKRYKLENDDPVKLCKFLFMCENSIAHSCRIYHRFGERRKDSWVAQNIDKRLRGARRRLKTDKVFVVGGHLVDHRGELIAPSFRYRKDWRQG